MSTHLSEAMQRLRRAAATRHETEPELPPGIADDLVALRQVITDEAHKAFDHRLNAKVREVVDQAIADHLPPMVNAAVRAELSLREQRESLQTKKTTTPPGSANRRIAVLAVLLAIVVGVVAYEPSRLWVTDQWAAGPGTWLANL